MRVGSLFAGIGGFDLGFERAGMHTAWQVELDPYCRAVLAKHFPDAERFEDVREVGAHNLAPVDLVCGGFPCQDLSAAGNGAGLDGARSALWFEFARIIRELRPRYVVVENVPDLLARGKRWYRAPVGRVLADLAESGYDAEWDCLPASAIGAPHQRDRFWLVAYPQNDGRGQGWPGRSPGGSQDGQGVAPQGMADSPRDAQAGSTSPAGSERERAGPSGVGGRARDVSDADPERCEVLSQFDGEPEPGGEASQCGRHADGSRDAVPDADGLGRQPGQRDLRARQPDPLGSSPELADPEGEPKRAGLRSRRSTGQRGRRSSDSGGEGGAVSHTDREQHQGASHALGRSPGEELRDHWATEPDVGRVADGVPARVDRLAALGNALVPQIAEWIGRRIVDFEEGGVR